jgi:hypothetical protein
LKLTVFENHRMKKHFAAKIPIYRNPALPAAKRVRDLLSRMTLEEKAAQMTRVWQKKIRDAHGRRGKF